MKFIAENIKELSQKSKDKNIKKTIRMVRNKIKMEAKNGYNMCIVDFYEDFSDTQQEIISDYFIKRNFKVEWCFDDRISVRWV